MKKLLIVSALSLAALGAQAGVAKPNIMTMFAPATHAAVASWALGLTCKELDKLAAQHDLPLHTLPA